MNNHQLSVIVHPLALLNISDSLNRITTFNTVNNLTLDEQTQRKSLNSVGGLLGIYNRRTETYAILFAFEISQNENGVAVDDLKVRLRLYKEVYPHLSFLGLYQISDDDNLVSSSKSRGGKLIVDHLNKTPGFSFAGFPRDTTGEDEEESHLLLLIHESFKLDKADTVTNKFIPMVIFKCSNSSEYTYEIENVEIKPLNIEKITLNTIKRSSETITESISKKTNLFKDLKTDASKSVGLLLNRLNYLIDYLRAIKSKNVVAYDNAGHGQSSNNYEILKEINELVIKLKQIKQYNVNATNEDELDEKTVKLALINQALLTENVKTLDELSLINSKV